MLMNQIAILLEIIGFLLASFFIAMLKVGVIKNLVDKAKSSIIDITETQRGVTSQIARAIVIVVLLALVNRMIKTRFPRGMKPWQYPVFLLHTLVFIYIIPVLEMFFFLLLVVFEKIVGFTAKKLTGKDVITNSLIILGSLLVLTGLILELIATF